MIISNTLITKPLFFNPYLTTSNLFRLLMYYNQMLGIFYIAYLNRNIVGGLGYSVRKREEHKRGGTIIFVYFKSEIRNTENKRESRKPSSFVSHSRPIDIADRLSCMREHSCNILLPILNCIFAIYICKRIITQKQSFHTLSW